MKTSYFSIALLMIFSFSFSQNKTSYFTFKGNISPTIFNTQSNPSVEVLSLQMLGKSAWEYNFDKDKINLTPKYFSWDTDSRRIESTKNMISNVQRQDLCGRDLPIDIHSEVIQKVYLRSLYYP